MLQGSSFLVQIQIALIGIVVIAAMFFMWRSIARLEERIDQLAAQCGCCAMPSGGGKSRKQCSSSSKYQDEDDYAEQMMKVFGTENPFDFDDNQNELMADEEVSQIIITTKANEAVVVDEPSKKFVIDSSRIPMTSVFTFTIPTTTEQSSVVISDEEFDTGELAGDIVVETPTPVVSNVATVATVIPEVVVDDDVSEADTDGNPLSKSKLKRMNVERLKELCRDRTLSVDGNKQTLIDRILGLARD